MHRRHNSIRLTTRRSCSMALKKQKFSFIGHTIVMLFLFGLAAAAPSTTTTKMTKTTAKPASTRFSNPLLERKYERNCKALCNHCNCLGFYCGEECICECNSDDNADTECIRTMQQNARSLNTPFEILLQGPSSNRFVRNALKFEQRNAANIPRSRRSTITIYQPTAVVEKSHGHVANALASSPLKHSELVRFKRSADHFEWFNDMANSWVRPAPKVGFAAKKRDNSASSVKAKKPLDFNIGSARKFWLQETSAPRPVQPAPLSKKSKKSKKTQSRKIQLPDISMEINNLSETHPLRHAIRVVDRIPHVLQKTASSLTADNGNSDIFNYNMDDVTPKKKSRISHERSSSKQQRKEPIIALQISNDIETTSASTSKPNLPFAGGLLARLRERRLERLQKWGHKAK